MSALIQKVRDMPLWRDMTAKSAYVAMVSCTGAAVYGYDVSWWSSVLGMPAFTKRFGEYNAAADSYSISAPLQSAGSAVPTAGLVFGSLLCFTISDRIGRRGAMLATSIMYLIAIIIEVTSNSYAQVVVGRFLNSIPQGMSASLLPAYQSECAPASCRGALVGLYTWVLDTGAVTAVGIVYHTYQRTDAGAYKIVMGVQGIYPLLILVFLYWLPESPRYLVMKGRDAEALSVLESLRVDKSTAARELEDIRASSQVHQDDSSWIDLVRGPNLRRTAITVFTAGVESWQGLSFIGNYLVVFFISLGTADTYYLVLLINSTLLITLTCFFWVPDYVGRRRLLLFGSVVMFSTFFIMAGVAGRDVSSISFTRQRVAVAMLFIWAIVYSSTWANGTWVTIGEMPQTRLRSKTSGLAYAVQSISGLVISLFSPYVQSDDYVNWGAYIGFFFGSFSFIAFWFVYFFYPEVKGLSIEKMDELFDQRASIKQFSDAHRGESVTIAGVISSEGSVDVERDVGAEKMVTVDVKAEAEV
ncbi:hypothetical protein SEUCBS139899_005580 [Sporothrix eucalyptigena]|uniref:Major facilitator superfamily (MFS) profile domain-containing protein n=1 Tax=Sporothrix eucalyptigena TaxID=1812306 RepID=A0ABP0C1F4_9PEZI